MRSVLFRVSLSLACLHWRRSCCCRCRWRRLDCDRERERLVPSVAVKQLSRALHDLTISLGRRAAKESVLCSQARERFCLQSRHSKSNSEDQIIYIETVILRSPAVVTTTGKSVESVSLALFSSLPHCLPSPLAPHPFPACLLAFRHTKRARASKPEQERGSGAKKLVTRSGS